MRFSFWPGEQSWKKLLEVATHAEATGWDRIYFADHFMPNGPDTSGPWSEAWTTIAALAASVPRVQIGPLVTGNTYRHPAVLAKMAATVDHISGGRLVLGLGAGWQENEHRAYGIPFHTMGGRLRRLEEACQVIQGLFANQKTRFEGEFYQLAEAPLEPKPIQTPVPLLIGGGGEKVTMRIAARYANEWNVWGDVETLRQKMKILDAHCTDVGRNPGEIRRSAVAMLFLSDDSDFIEKIRSGSAGRPIIVGNVEEVAQVVKAYADAGVDELVVPDFNLGPTEAKLPILDRFITEIAPDFRTGG